MDIGIDLGTANIIISMGNRGVVLNEPSVVAFNKKTNQVMAVGSEAYRMLGRTPEHIVAVRPLSDGVISDYNMTESMIREFIYKVSGKQQVMPRILFCIPSFITDVESRAVVEAAKSAGARRVLLIEEPIAALIGAGVNIEKPDGNMVIDIGGGTTDAAVISMCGIVAKRSIKQAGNKLDQAIIRYIEKTYKMLIGEKTAEGIKISLTNLYNPQGRRSMEVKGRNLINGLPEKFIINDFDVYYAIIDIMRDIVASVKEVIEQTPPELVGDIHTNGIFLTGGGALLGGLAPYISAELGGVKCRVAEDATLCVAKGTAKAFSMLDILRDGFENVSPYKYR